MMQIHSPRCLLDLSVQLTRRGECGTRETEKLANGLASRGTQWAIAAVVAFCHRNHQFKVGKGRLAIRDLRSWILGSASPWFSRAASRHCAPPWYLALTKTDWNTTEGISRYPVTLSFAKKVGQLKTELPENFAANLFYRFYM
jgi:hypothetical protein